MYVLDSTTKTLVCVLAASATSREPDYTVHYADVTAALFTEGSVDGALTSITPKTILDAPAASTRRMVREITIYNRDTMPITFTLSLDNSSGSTSRFLISITLASGQSWSSSGGASPVTVSQVVNTPLDLQVYM